MWPCERCVKIYYRSVTTLIIIGVLFLFVFQISSENLFDEHSTECILLNDNEEEIVDGTGASEAAADQLRFKKPAALLPEPLRRKKTHACEVCAKVIFVLMLVFLD